MQARYKVGRCLHKLGRTDEAFNQYYTEVMCVYLDERSKGVAHDAASDVWFTKAALDAVEMLEAKKKWREAVRLLKRVVSAGVPAARKAQERIDRIRLKHWILIY